MEIPEHKEHVPELDEGTELLVRKLVEQRVSTYVKWANAALVALLAGLSVVGGLILWAANGVMQTSVHAAIKGELDNLKDKLDAAEARLVQVQTDAAEGVATAKIQFQEANRLAKEAEQSAATASKTNAEATKAFNEAKTRSSEAGQQAAQAKMNSDTAQSQAKEAIRYVDSLKQELDNAKEVREALKDIGSFTENIATNEQFQSAVIRRILNPDDGVVRITGGLQVDGALTVIDSPDWIAAELEPGWSAFERGYAKPSYLKDSLGVVHLRGSVYRKGNEAVRNENDRIIFRLEEGLRPASRLVYVVNITGNKHGRVDILPDGRVRLGTDALNLSLEGITFRSTSDTD